jgi:hypothetical protein
MSQPSFGGRRFLLLGVLEALGALRFIRAHLSALGKNALPFWKPFGIHKDWVSELVVDSQYPRIFIFKTRCNSETGPYTNRGPCYQRFLALCALSLDPLV